MLSGTLIQIFETTLTLHKSPFRLGDSIYFRSAPDATATKSLAIQALDLFKLLFTIAEGLRAHLHLVHHREEQSGELAIGFTSIIKSTATLDATTGPTKDDHWKLIVIVESTGHHAGTVHQHRVIQQGARTFLDCVKLSGKVSDLLHKELVYLQPVFTVAVRQQVVDHIVDAVTLLLNARQIRES